MPADQSTDDTAAAVNDFSPRTASTHLSAPWRWVLLLTALGLAMPCGIAAAAPVWNGADLAVLIILAIFVAAFTPGKD